MRTSTRIQDRPRRRGERRLLRWLCTVLALAVVNYAAGRAGLQLAIPPGFATAVFPPSGIALAALLIFGPGVWPGVFLGSLSFNLHQAILGSHVESWQAVVLVAACIALGSTLQAAVGAQFLSRFIGSTPSLVREKHVVAFLAVGPASCLVAATCGVATLAAAGMLAEGTRLYTWWTWWVGDAIGVLIFVPLALAALAKPREVWRPRRLSVAMPLAVAFCLVVMVFVLVSKRQHEAIRLRFEDRVGSLDRALLAELNGITGVLWSVRSFFAGSQEVDPDEFRTFTRRALAAHPGLLALSWNVRVRGEDRERFVERVRNDVHPNFEITERTESGELVPAGPRDEHVAVLYIEPKEGNEEVLGFDVHSDEARRAALADARDGDEPAATRRLTFVQDEGRIRGVLLFMPVYETDVAPATIAERREAVLGYAVAVLHVDELIATALSSLPTEGTISRLWDTSAPEGARLLGAYPPGAGPPGRATTSRRAASLEVVSSVSMGGRAWELHVVPTDDYAGAQTGWEAWIVLAGGLTFVGLLGAILLVITGRAAVDAQRLREIADVNRRLQLTNEELARFAYAASHDLKSPLRAVDQLAGFLAEDLAGTLDEEASRYLDLMRARVKRMQGLLADLLAFSRVGWIKDRPEPVDTCALVCEVFEMVVGHEHFDLDLGDLPIIQTDRAPLAQVLRNLIGNAVKHNDRGAGRVSVDCRPVDGGYEFSVSDDGRGIPPEHQGRVFEMFQTLRPRDDVEGSGMGLALVRKIVGNRNGLVSLESDGVSGTTVRFTWPAGVSALRTTPNDVALSA